jgi:cyclopropane fatty-acyl-phospholipid synthase-like methyltransferase
LNRDLPVLDIGIGQGRNSFYLAENGFSVVGLDSSITGLDYVSERSNLNNLAIETNLTSFKDFYPRNKKFGGILVFGLIQILSWEDITSLREKIDQWISKNGILFITAFTIFDDSFKKYKNLWNSIGKNSFSDGNDIRTFLEENELIRLFCNYDVIQYWEGVEPEHRHGNGPLEKHHLVEAVFRKK